VPRAPRITRRQDPIVQRLRRLAVKGREDSHVLLDGEHLVDEALRAGVPVELVLTDARHAALARRARDAGAGTYEGTAPVLEAASPVQTPSGVVAIARWTTAEPAAVLASPAALVLALVDVQDPGNVGSVIRGADALGATGVIATGSTANPAGWKALRGAMGSTFRLPVAVGKAADVLKQARARGLRLVGTSREGGTAVSDYDWRRPSLVLLGNEGAGLPATLLTDVDERVTIQMREGVDSLNVAATAAVILYEARRQRTGGAHDEP
jgi:TrmH family RNA methyltransferase